MDRRRVLGDLGIVTTWVLLVAATAAIVTGIVAHAWDLDGFVLHTRAGYVMAVAALVHVALSWRRLVDHSAQRLARARSLLHARVAGGDTPRTPPVEPSAESPASTGSTTAETAQPPRGVTRRGLIGAALAGGAGFLAGRGLRPPPPIEAGSDLGLVYHEWSKPGIVDALGTLADWGDRPPQYKQWPDSTPTPLPPPDLTGGPPLREVVATRHSTRDYVGGMPLATLSTLLALTGGLRPGEEHERTQPSPGALYPLEVYPVVNAVEGLEPGIYHYDVRGHGLTTLRTGDTSAAIRRGGLDQAFLAEADVVLVVTAILQRLRWRYRDRSYRYALLEAGHLGQNLYLGAGSLGLGACAVGAFRDDEVNDLLGVDGREELAVYLLAAGTTIPSGS